MLISATWWAAVVFAVVFALLWALLHIVIVPRIDQFRPRLENILSHSLGVPVRIDAITAQSNNLVPSFELQKLRLLDSTGRDALVLKKVTAALSPRSLLRMDFEQLVIDQPELDIRRMANGRILVAGIDFSQPDPQSQASSPAADWFFSQREFIIRGGILRWTDEQRSAPALTLNQMNVVLRNTGRSHTLRIDATPSPAWGARFSILGDFRRPLLGGRSGQWRDWEGELHANFSQVDVAQLKRYANLGIDISQGRGALRLWSTLSHGQITGATADVALTDVDVRLAKNLQPIVMPQVSGRLSGQKLAGGFRFATEGLAFRTAEGIQWPGGNVAFLQTGHEGKVQAMGELNADRLDLAALAQIADRLPLGTATHALIRSLNPSGLVDTVQASWQGDISAPRGYEARGKISGLSIQAQQIQAGLVETSVHNSSTSTHSAGAARPGIRGATVSFKFNQYAGDAQVAIKRGALELPGVFEDPVLLFDSMSTEARWTINSDKIDLNLVNIKFVNADGQGEAQAHWSTADPQKSNAKSRFPGVLDLNGVITRAEGNRVYRYLPLTVGKPARDYVRDAVLQGKASAGKFKLKGDLFDMPFADPKLGEFRISAQVNNALFAYVPKTLQPKDSLPWPALAQLNGELVIERASLAVNAAKGRIGSETSNVQFTNTDARIADLGRSATVVLSADLRGPLAEVLTVVNSSPLSEMTSKSLSKATGTGNADVKLRMGLPLFSIERSKVQGSVTLVNSDVQIAPDSPVLARAKGLITFNESGFAVKDAQARMMGGDLRLEGGTRTNTSNAASTTAAANSEPSIVFKAQGNATAEGLRQAKELGFVSRLAESASGGTSYTATLGFRRGVPEIAISSNLQGMALSLPAPLNKTADAILPLRYENSLVRESLASGQKLQDRLVLDLGSIASIQYIRDVSGNEPRVLRGGIGVGLAANESAPTADDGVAANINFGQINVDAWEKAMGRIAGADLTAAPTNTPGTASTAAVSSSLAMRYLPSVIAVRASELVVQGRTLHNVVVGGSRDGLTWRANMDARELNGYMEYRQSSSSSPGRVYARLARLNIAQSQANEIEATLDEKTVSIPALDIVVEDMELRGKRLGRVEIEAVNRGAGQVTRESGAQEWRLNKLNVILPEAQFSATGNWVAGGATAEPTNTARPANERRRTVMNFKFDIADSGALLTRLGYANTVAKGKGKMEGQIAWLGSPLSLDYPSMNGNFNINIESGRFIKADPGIAKLLGVLSLQSLPRRLTLDFRDVFSDGFSFDFVRGDVKVEQGVLIANNLQTKGVNAAILMDGRADIAKQTVDIKTVVIPEINAGTASLIATVINPAIGLGTFLAQLFLRKPLMEAATQEFHVEGTWDDIKFTKVDRKSSNKTPFKSSSTEAVP